MDPVLLQQLLVPSAAVQRVSETQEFPAERQRERDRQRERAADTLILLV